MVRPAPSSPERLPVEACTATASASMPSSSATDVAHPVEPGAAEARPCARDGQVERAGPQPRAAEPRDDLTAAARRLSMPAVSGSPAGNSRPRSPMPAPPRGARRTPHGAPRRRRNGRGAGAPRACRGPPAAARRGCRTDGCRRPARTARRAGYAAAGTRLASDRTVARSAGSVILSAPASPGTVTTATPWRASSSCSSPKSPGRRRTPRWPPRSSSRRAPWGVCARNSVAPVGGRRDHDRRRVTCLSESTTGSTGMAAPWARPRLATRSASADVASGRAASWTRTTSTRSARTPVATESWRRGPPATTDAPGARQPRLGAQGAAIRSGAVTTMMSRTAARAAHRVDRPVERRAAADGGARLVGAAHAAAGTGGDDDGVGEAARVGEHPLSVPYCPRHPVARRAARARRLPGQPPATGWAKTIRPATVWRTRVTWTSSSRWR